MKKLLIAICCLFIGIQHAATETINWYVDDVVYATTSCDSGDSITIPTPPTKYGYVFMGWRQDFVPLEYVESDGTQYIDTGIPTQTGIGFDVTFLTTSPFTDSGSQGAILGCRKSSLVQDFQLTTYKPSGKSYGGEIRYGTKEYDAKFSRGVIQHVSLINNTITYNDGKQNTIPQYDSFDGTRNIFLFAQNYNNNGPLRLSKTRIYNIKLLIGDDIIFNGIPAKRTEDDTIGMYDSVSNTFFTNAGTGDFIAGPAIGIAQE